MGSEENLDELLNNVNYETSKRANKLCEAAGSLSLEQIEKEDTYHTYRYNRYGKYIIERVIGENLFRFEYHDTKEYSSLNIYVDPKRFVGLKRFFGYTPAEEVLDMTIHYYKEAYKVSVKILKHGNWEETLIKEAERVRSAGTDGNTETPYVEADIWVNDETILKHLMAGKI